MKKFTTTLFLLLSILMMAGMTSCKHSYKKIEEKVAKVNLMDPQSLSTFTQDDYSEMVSYLDDSFKEVLDNKDFEQGAAEAEKNYPQSQDMFMLLVIADAQGKLSGDVKKKFDTVLKGVAEGLNKQNPAYGDNFLMGIEMMKQQIVNPQQMPMDSVIVEEEELAVTGDSVVAVEELVEKAAK